MLSKPVTTPIATRAHPNQRSHMVIIHTTYVARTRLKGQSVGVGHVSDTGTAGTRLPACPRGVEQENNIILFRTRS